MADDNKPIKYMRYALGEILLVVIGILIALWINSSYQDYKNKQITKTYLNDFKRDLVSDTIALNERIKRNETMIQSVDSIFQFLFDKNELSPNELLAFLNYNIEISHESYFIPEKSTIRQLESGNNGGLIPSKLLKDKLFEYHTTNDRNEKNTEISLQLYQHSFFTRDFIKGLMVGEVFAQLGGEESPLKKESFDEIKNNTNYLASLVHKKDISKNQSEKYQELILKADEILKLIDLELD